MKDLIIFGDSFASEIKEDLHSEFLKNNKAFSHLADLRDGLITYHSFLRNSNVFKSVTTYGIEGDDLWHQFKKFQEVYTGNELVLFFETQFGRITSPAGVACTNMNTVKHLQHQASTFKNIIDEDFSLRKKIDANLKILAAAEEYFLYLQRDDYDKFANTAIINEIKRINPSVLIIPCFKSCITYEGNALIDISNAEFNVKNMASEIFEIRRNHLTEENHKVLAEQVIEYFTKDTDIDFNKFIKTPNTDFNKYFIKLKQRET